MKTKTQRHQTLAMLISAVSKCVVWMEPVLELEFQNFWDGGGEVSLSASELLRPWRCSPAHSEEQDWAPFHFSPGVHKGRVWCTGLTPDFLCLATGVGKGLDYISQGDTGPAKPLLGRCMGGKHLHGFTMQCPRSENSIFQRLFFFLKSWCLNMNRFHLVVVVGVFY